MERRRERRGDVAQDVRLMSPGMCRGWRREEEEERKREGDVLLRIAATSCILHGVIANRRRDFCG